MGVIVETIFDTFTEVMTGLSEGLTTAFNHILYTYDASGNINTSEFNPLILFIFTVAGIGLAAGILWKMFGMIKGASGRAGG